MKELSDRGTRVCRGCDSDGLTSVLDLGDQPLANEMALSQATPDPRFPLHLRVCAACGLGQVGEYVLPERIFGAEYPYLSSVSSSWVAHAGQYATSMVDRLGLAQGDLVVEVASNDGYLLEQMQRLGMNVLGVEPAHGVADIARAKGVPTVSEFFGLDVQINLRDVLTNLGISSHFEDFPKGAIDLKHVAYYVMFVAYFLFMTVRSVETRKWR